MKRIKVFAAIAVITTLTLAGCAGMSERAEDADEDKYGASALECIAGDNMESIGEYRDKETGVHYFSVYREGFTVRINADGTPYVD